MPTHQLVFGCAEAPARECSGDDDLQDFLTREGFGAYEINSGAQIVSDDMKLQISRMGMLPVLRCVSRDLNESEACLIQAKMLGASVACMRLGAANAEEEASRDLVQTVLTKFKDACINLRFEVHPSTIFANLGKTAHWCELFPEVNLALDAEMLLEESADTDEGSAPDLRPGFSSLVPKTAMLRATIPDSAIPRGDVPPQVKLVWKRVMQQWRRHAPAGRWLLFMFDFNLSHPHAPDPVATREFMKRYREAALSCWQTALDSPADDRIERASL
ncbi:hypothetical protein CVU37_13590 [candidate division BRC1 bacterium HGW-BRC1-1]|jgi:hypothetical protein|nr:MAG: hypothetical protein CVU37_13590 [candidate division BRC1 bacterium HGW-BRC1-1]